MTKIILAFPCMGKTYYAQNHPAKALDLESSDYFFDKTGKLITFDEKVDNWKLKEKVTAKIVSETNHQYQVEVDGNFYNMSKSDVD